MNMNTTTNIHDHFLASDLPIHGNNYDRNKCFSNLEPFNITNNYLIRNYTTYSYSIPTLPYQQINGVAVYDNSEINLDSICPIQTDSKTSDGEISIPVSSSKRKGRKPKNPNIPSRLENKLNRNSNKKYINYKGVEVEPKKFLDFDCKCAKKCNKKLTADERKSEFEKFWALSSYDSQTAFIAAKVTEKPVKNRYGKTDIIKKDFSRKYILCYTPVCRLMFVKTLQISTGRINTALTKLRTKHTIKDQRGLKRFYDESVLTSSIADSFENTKEASECNYVEKPLERINQKVDTVEECNNSSLDDTQICQQQTINDSISQSVCLQPLLAVNDNISQNSCHQSQLGVNGSITQSLCQQSEQTLDDNLSQSVVAHSSESKQRNIDLIGKFDPNLVKKPVLDVPMNVCSIVFTDTVETSHTLPCNVMKQAINIEENTLFERKTPARKGRKPKYSVTRKENQANRNSNKPYLNYKGELVQPKKFTDFNCKCTKTCQSKIPAEDRKREFEKFWALSYDSQTAYIVAAVSEEPVKRRYAKKLESKKDFSRKYALGADCVCRDMFCRTLNISPGRINTALKKYRLRCPLSDQRGIKQGGRNKLPAEKKNGVVKFMKRIPVYKSHHSKEKGKSKFLPPDLSIAKLYELYKEEEKDNAVSQASFKKIFYSFFNIRSKEPCGTCELLKSHMRKDLNSSKSVQTREKFNHHKELSDKCKSYFENDIALAKKYPDIECLSFEMARALPLPRIPTNVMCFMRSLWLYNLGIYSAKKDQSYCYVWPEGRAGKGAQEVGSCLLKHLKEEVVWWPDILHLVLWANPCGGLNRNIKLIIMLQSLLQSSTTLKTIKLKFLVSGHSQLPIQRDFVDIEKALKNHNPMYMPEDYINVMRHCRKKKPLVVKQMANCEFLSTEQLEQHVFRAIDTYKIKLSDVHEISMFANDPFTVYFKTDFDENAVTINFRTLLENPQLNNFTQFFVPLWPLGKPIIPAKLKDLKSVMHLIPAHAKSFYSTLQCGSTNEEDVDGFNEQLDFEIENRIK